MSDTWCPLPWVGMWVKPHGEVYICCESKTVSGNIYNNTLSEIIEQNEIYTQTRRELSYGIRSTECNACWKRENELGRSYRTWWNSKGAIERLGGEPFDVGLRYLHIDFSNGCNMKCPMCSIHRSTGWWKDRRKLSAMNIQPVTKSADFYARVWGEEAYIEAAKQVEKEFVDENWDTIFNCAAIELSGGEPFYSKAAVYLIEKLVENKYPGVVKIITNASLIEPYLDMISNLHVSLVISVEGHGEYYEYMRPTVGMKFSFDDFERVIDKFDQYRKLDKGNFSYGFAYVPQALNIHNTMDWLNWARTKNTNSLVGPPLNWPSFMDARHHPNEQHKLDLIKQLEDFPSYNVEDSHIKAFINNLKQEPDPKEHEAFMIYLEKLGEIRGVDYSKIYWF